MKKHERALLKTPKLPGNDALGLYQGYLTLLQPAAIKEANQKLKDRIRQLERELAEAFSRWESLEAGRS